jgi:carbon monoxide dehydrogenase subunit G
MKIEGTYPIAAPQSLVWRKLMDPAVLQRSMPGCEKLEPTGENRYRAVLKAGVGPVKGTFNSEVAISDIDDDRGYTLTTKAKAPVGFVEGSGRVQLVENAGQTIIHFIGEVKVGGALASIGGRLIEAAAKKNIHDTFANLARECGAAPATTPATQQLSDAEPAS